MNRRAFGERVTAMQGSLYRVAASYLRGESDRLDAVAEAIASLPQKARTMIVLHYMEGYDVREIAKMMGTTKGAVCAGLSRAREKLRAYLEEDAR